ncbi:hypothetical protein V6N13_001563 [Hibiscus sabdariffa]|uniref:Uncharacterized protein n=1 Tax=Hibiscus sabdariffa TaxID=183260 RepID=A0ABR2G9H3_9ROSI
MSLILICHPFHASKSAIGQVPTQAEQGHLEVVRWTPRLHSMQGRTRPPRGGEVDPTAPFHTSRSACSSHSRCAGTRPPRGGEATFALDQAYKLNPIVSSFEPNISGFGIPFSLCC